MLPAAAPPPNKFDVLEAVVPLPPKRLPPDAAGLDVAGCAPPKEGAALVAGAPKLAKGLAAPVLPAAEPKLKGDLPLPAIINFVEVRCSESWMGTWTSARVSL